MRARLEESLRWLSSKISRGVLFLVLPSLFESRLFSFLKKAREKKKRKKCHRSEQVGRWSCRRHRARFKKESPLWHCVDQVLKDIDLTVPLLFLLLDTTQLVFLRLLMLGILIWGDRVCWLPYYLNWPLSSRASVKSNQNKRNVCLYWSSLAASGPVFGGKKKEKRLQEPPNGVGKSAENESKESRRIGREVCQCIGGGCAGTKLPFFRSSKKEN